VLAQSPAAGVQVWPVGLPTQVPLLQMGFVDGQSPLVQQLAAGMHAPLHALKLGVLHGNVQVLPLQTPIVPAGGFTHSALAQHAGRALPMQRFVPAQFLKVALQVMPQLVPLHDALPFAVGAGHAWQLAPQALTSFALQMPPLHARWPVTWHMPLQAMLLSMHVPAQMYWFGFVHTGTQLIPSQLTVPPVGAAQATLHAVAPQLLRSLLLTHFVPHWW
jgi:hypothetical protein